jgi:putative peptidoglycan lipid II flippase
MRLTSATIRQASLLLALSGLLSNVLGLLRNILFYRLIGLENLDVYFASFRVPDLLLNLLVFGAISNAFIPIFSSLKSTESPAKARAFADQSFTWLTVVFGVVAILLTLAMRPIMAGVVQGFDAVRFEQTVVLSRVLMLQALFFAWSFTCGGYLNAHRRFTTPALAPIIYNLSIISGGFLAVHWGISAIVWSAVAGAALHFGIQAWEMKSAGYWPRLNFGRTPELKQLVRLMIPRSVSQGMSQLALIFYTSLASTLAVGSIAIYSGMNDLQTTPTVILANSIAVAILPVLAASAAKNEWGEFSRVLQKALRTTFFVLLPSIILAFVLRAQIVRLYVSMGDMTWEQTEIAIATFTVFLYGIIPAALVAVLARVFYAIQDSRTPMYLSIAAGIVGIGSAKLFVDGGATTVSWLALAFVIASWTQAILFIYFLKRHAAVRLGLVHNLPRLFGYTLAASAAGAACWLTLRGVDAIYRSTGWLGTHYIAGLSLQLVLAGMVGLLVVLGYSKLVFPEEYTWIRKPISSKPSP